MSIENKQKRPKYTLEFKKDAAKLVIEKGYTQEQAANNLGISKCRPRLYRSESAFFLY